MQPTPKNSHDIAYRSDIDGLRTVAVLSVIFFHYFPSVLPGGFVGVDIFFVISGFLISAGIYKNLQAKRFSFADFYARRIRRIFPALIVLLVFSWICGWLFLLPNEFIQLGKHLSAAIGFYSNIQLRRESGYFDGSSDLKPLLHLWSLGIEEQFYFIWPLLLFVAWRCLAHKSRLFLAFLLAIIGLSFGLNVKSLQISRVDAFYLPQNRVWELLIGSLAAYLQLQGVKPGRRLSQWAAVLGMLLIALAIASLGPNSLFPGWWATVPCLGAALLLLAGPETWIAKNILSRSGMVFIGLISYPLYLWHWPALTYARIAEGAPPGLLMKCILLGASFALAYVTYRYIEIPLREAKRPLVRTAQMLFAVMACFLVISIPTSYGRLLNRFANAYTLDVLAAKMDHDYPGSRLAGEELKTNVLPGQSSQKLVVLGDSHAAHYWPRFKALHRREPPPFLTTVFATYDGCLPLPDSGAIAGWWDIANCDIVFRIAFKLAMEADVKRVVFSAHWERLLLKSEWMTLLDGLERKLVELKKAGKDCVIVLPNPTGAEYTDQSFIKSRYRLPETYVMPPLPRQTFESKVAVFKERLKNMAARTGARLLDPADWLCNATECPTMVDGKVIYSDQDHIRASFVASNAKFLDELVKAP